MISYSCILVLVTLGMPGYAHPEWYSLFAETSSVYLYGKNQFHAFLKIPQRYANLLWYFGHAWLYTTDFILSTCKKTSMFICMSKIKFIFLFLPEILYSIKTWNFSIGPVTEDPELYQIWYWCWNINNNINFHFRLFARKSNDEIFQKIQKNLILGLFC